MTIPHPHASAVRAEKLACARKVGIDRGFIDRLVEQFYAKVRHDPLLAPVFAARFADWAPHLARMKQFWTAILTGESVFTGSPMTIHQAIPAIEVEHFARWLDLFDQTLRELEGNPAATALVGAKARIIADSLLTGIRVHRDGRKDIQAMKRFNHA